MSLTNEQVIELNRLNEMYRRFEAKAEESHLDAEELVHQFMAEEFQMFNPERAHMEDLAKKRKELLDARNKGPLQKVSRDGESQLSFD